MDQEGYRKKPNFTVLTNVKEVILPPIQSRFDKLTLNSPFKLNPRNRLPDLGHSNCDNDKNLVPTDTNPTNNCLIKPDPSTLTNKIMLSSSSSNTEEEQTIFNNRESNSFTERLQLSESVKATDTTSDYNNQLRDRSKCSQRISEDMFSISQSSSESSQFSLPLNKVVSVNSDLSIKSISQKLLSINMLVEENSLPETVGNTPSSKVEADLDDTLPNIKSHKISEGNLRCSSGADLDTISLSSESENNSSLTEDSDEDCSIEIIEITSSDEDVSPLNSIHPVRITETEVQKLNDFFDNVPILSVPPNKYRENIDLCNQNKTNSNNVSGEVSEISVSETTATSNKNDNESSILEQKSQHGISNSPGSKKSLDKSGTSSPLRCSNTQQSKECSDPKTLESQFSSLVLNSPKINISAKININIQLSVSSSSSSDTDTSLKQNTCNDIESKESIDFENSVEEIAGEDQFRERDAISHTADSHRSNISESKNTSNVESENYESEISHKDDSIIESSLINSAKKSCKGYTLPNSSNTSLNPSNNNAIGFVGESPAVECSASKNDATCDVKTPKMIKSVTPKSFTAIPKLNDTNDFTSFQQNIICDLESTRIDSDEKTIEKANEKLIQTSTNHQSKVLIEKTPSGIASVNMRGRILRTKVLGNPKFDSSIKEEETDNGSDSDISFKPNRDGQDYSDSSFEEVNVPTPASKKKKSKLLYLDLSYAEVIEDEDHDNPDASPEQLEGISINFLKSLEYETAIKTPMPKKTRKLFTPNYDNETPFEDEKTPFSTPKIVECSVVKLKTPIPTFLVPPHFRREKLDSKSNICEEATPTSIPKSILRKRQQTPIVSSPGSNQMCGFLESLDAKIIPDVYCHPDARKFRNNFKLHRKELADRLTQLYNEKIFDNRLGDVIVSWNKSLTRTAGVCKYRKRGAIHTCSVELSDKVLTQSDRLRDTLIHELCHAATWIFNKETAGHGASWKAWTQKATKRLPELPEIQTCHNYEIEYKYTYKCVICGMKSQAHSKSKKVENIRCSSCHGAIEVFLNKRDKDGQITLIPPKPVSGFAKFVKENYKSYKIPGSVHANVMKILGNNFSKMSAQEKLKYK